MYKANIHITLRPSILDPQGKATHHALTELGFARVEQVRIGKYIEMWIDVEEEAEAERVAREACEQLLANPVMEDFAITLERVSPRAAT
ncbi:MAG: phosphoribosylformylglycinamidine synthase subunit PurS [Bacteroidetes bacterium]|nr:MAG: phosphoribosylformylglycinamidine synthase subunit PurS [Bacteroidota bacterium]